jgi:integrase
MLNPITQPEENSARIEEAIINTLLLLTNSGKAESTLRMVNHNLKQISQHTNLFDPEAVKQHIANAKTEKGEPFELSTKNTYAYCYDQFCKIQNIAWKKPYFIYTPKVPLIPSTENVNKILNCATTRFTTIFTLLIETGAEAQELHKVKQSDIDKERGIISITGVKRHDSGTYKLKVHTTEMLRVYLCKNTGTYPFPLPQIMGQVWYETRKRASIKLCQPELRKISMRNLRNYSGAILYYKTHDPIGVKRHLRHKKLETTMHYLSGITVNGEEEEFICKTAKTIQEATELIEAGFQYITEMEGLKLFKKRK